MMTAFLGLIIATRIFTVQAIHEQMDVSIAADSGTRIAYTKISIKGNEKSDPVALEQRS